MKRPWNTRVWQRREVATVAAEYCDLVVAKPSDTFGHHPGVPVAPPRAPIGLLRVAASTDDHSVASPDRRATESGCGVEVFRVYPRAAFEPAHAVRSSDV